MKCQTVVLGIVLLLAACGSEPASTASPPATSSPRPTATSSHEPSPSTSAEPTSSAVARPVEADNLVETVVERLVVREEPGLAAAPLGIAPAGMRAWVLDGPVEADGYGWFLLTGAPEDLGDPTACLEAGSADLPCVPWSGWAAGKTPSGDAWLRAVVVDCPATRDVSAYLSLTPEERLLCAGDDDWQLEVYVPPLEGGRGCFPVWVTDPGWMTAQCTFTLPQSVERELDEDTSLQMFTPPELNTCGQPGVCWWNEHKGEWVLVTGHLDDPVARSCRPVLAEAFENEDVMPPPDGDLVVHECRLHFVVSSVKRDS